MSLGSAIMSKLSDIPEVHLTEEKIAALLSASTMLHSQLPAIEAWITAKVELPAEEDDRIAAYIAAKLGVSEDIVLNVVKEAQTLVGQYLVSEVDTILTYDPPASSSAAPLQIVGGSSVPVV